MQIRLDADVLEWLKQSGPGYQTRANAILRQAMLQSELGGFMSTIEDCTPSHEIARKLAQLACINDNLEKLNAVESLPPNLMRS